MNKVVVTKEALMHMMLHSVKIGKLISKIEDIADLVVAKNTDYGDAWQRYGIFTPLIRINDKILRVGNLADGREALIAEESISDTLVDIIGYSTLALMWLCENGKAEDINKAIRDIRTDLLEVLQDYPNT